MSNLQRPRPRSPPSTASAPGPRQRPVTCPVVTPSWSRRLQSRAWRRGLVQEKLKRHLSMRSVINVRQGNRFRTLVVTICYIRLSWSYCLQVYNLHFYMVTSNTSTHTSLDSVWNSTKSSDCWPNEIMKYRLTCTSAKAIISELHLWIHRNNPDWHGGN